MGRTSKIQNAFKPSKISKATPKGAAGYDNPRENIDPQIKTQVIFLPLSTGSVLFVGPKGQITADNANLFWDDINKSLIVGAGAEATPSIAIGAANYGIYKAGGVLAFTVNSDWAWQMQQWNFAPSDTGGSMLRETPTATNPTILGNKSDLDTGLAWATWDQLSLVAGGVEMFRFVEGASDYSYTMLPVGIGTSSPDGILDVSSPGQPVFVTQSTGTSSVIHSFKNTNDEWQIYLATTTGDLRFWNGADKVTFEAGGNVGIGTSSPQKALHVDNGTFNNQFRISRSGQGHWDFVPSGGRLLFMDENGDTVITLEDDPNYLGVDTQTPTTTISAKEKGGMTPIGGFAVKLTNKTGGNTVAGQLVAVYSATAVDDAFKTAAANDDGVIGVVLDAGVADGAEAWIVVSGIADVLMDAGGSARGDRLIASATAGSADVWNTGGAVATHFLEIGHCIETRGGAGLARAVLHFN